MVPVESGRLVARNGDAIVELLPGRDCGVDDLVLMTDGRNRHAVEVEIRDRRIHAGRVAIRVPRHGFHLVGSRAIAVPLRQVIVQMDDQAVARMDAQCGRLQTVIGDITVAGRALADHGLLIAKVQPQFEDSVMAAQLGRVLNGCARNRAGAKRTRLLCGAGGCEKHGEEPPRSDEHAASGNARHTSWIGVLRLRFAQPQRKPPLRIAQRGKTGLIWPRAPGKTAFHYFQLLYPNRISGRLHRRPEERDGDRARFSGRV